MDAALFVARSISVLSVSMSRLYCSSDVHRASYRARQLSVITTQLTHLKVIDGHKLWEKRKNVLDFKQPVALLDHLHRPAVSINTANHV